ncbi:hypothetical protein L226DRAFT_250834 [Lentinus tigrinus ALCF2SS1-7]|uniref:Uncharacterized protein n=1 Tax=Lentinus tigrinus ALCF2SS1-6 TaxID=1328759 RepID=A0A5C2RLU7_9APHY|nr:hypothetical protein L227DRAFT_40520 [Lentinus tigrinus ALCF2SS1-6]RPD79478.1 hypothetical protein L226DRAFT_250834 [Lentinus tigrinus ALCF2SS1-7]
MRAHSVARPPVELICAQCNLRRTRLQSRREQCAVYGRASCCRHRPGRPPSLHAAVSPSFATPPTVTLYPTSITQVAMTSPRRRVPRHACTSPGAPKAAHPPEFETTELTEPPQKARTCTGGAMS